jgi:hypothetical protein
LIRDFLEKVIDKAHELINNVNKAKRFAFAAFVENRIGRLFL